MRVRRVVTFRDEAGKSAVLMDGSPPQEKVLEHTPGFVSSPVWKLDGAPKLSVGDRQDRMAELTSLLPGPGGASFLVITFPPDSVYLAADFQPQLSAAEHAAASPGLAELFEPDVPGMHTTPTVDFVTVIEGSLVLELDDGKTVSLTKGDTVVQQGTRHAWRNPNSTPATISVVLIGAA